MVYCIGETTTTSAISSALITNNSAIAAILAIEIINKISALVCGFDQTKGIGKLKIKVEAIAVYANVVSVLSLLDKKRDMIHITLFI